MQVLIIKLNATGDVVRTTTLLHRFDGPVTWITARNNMPLFKDSRANLRCLSWEDREQARDTAYDLVINLEDEPEQAAFVASTRHDRIYGARLDATGAMTYSDDAQAWFDLSLISRHGRKQADHLKLLNRRTYQDLVFSGLGFTFSGETYLLPQPTPTDLKGDVAIANVAGPVWPMKNWAYYDRLKVRLEQEGLRVNVLPRRQTLLEHLGDVANHRCLVGGDSLPMHMALGLGVPCVSLFTCTSPWEIFEYGLQTKIISPLLEEFFYQRGFDARATTAITLDQVYDAVKAKLDR